MKNRINKFAALAALLLLFGLPALAQSEIAPDHFPDPQDSVSAKVQNQIFEQQALLESYQAKITAKAKEVEQARAFLDTAGGIEDMSGAQLFLYKQEGELADLRNSLAEPIRLAQAKLATSTGEPTVASAGKPSGNSTTAAQKTASAHKRQSKTSAEPVLHASVR